MKIGFVGSGNMAAAMARGWHACGADGPEAMLFCDAGSGRAAELAAEVGGEAVAGNPELAKRSDAVVLAMKPSQLDQVAAEIAPANKPVVSVLGATSLERLQAALPDCALVRVMPNIAVEVRRGVLCWSARADLYPALLEQLVGLLSALGTTIELEDRLIDPATALMGTTPAYVAVFAEALVDAGIKEGIKEAQAEAMVVETLAGSAALLAEHDSLTVRRRVTSPGGTTAAGLAELERGGVRGAVLAAVTASLERMRG